MLWTYRLARIEIDEKFAYLHLNQRVIHNVISLPMPPCLPSTFLACTHLVACMQARTQPSPTAPCLFCACVLYFSQHDPATCSHTRHAHAEQQQQHANSRVSNSNGTYLHVKGGEIERARESVRYIMPVWPCGCADACKLDCIPDGGGCRPPRVVLDISPAKKTSLAR